MSDCHNVVEKSANSNVGARAAFQIALNHASGFSGNEDIAAAVDWFERSANSGFRIAQIFLPSLKAIVPPGYKSHAELNQLYHEACLQAIKEMFMLIIVQTVDNDDATETQDISLSTKDLATRADLNSKDICGNTPLMLACKFGRVKQVRWLLEHKADTSLVDDRGCSALHWLFMFSNKGLELLLELSSSLW